MLAKLFSLLTRYKEAEPTSIEPIIEECINLPCQVMIPALDTVITARGLSYILISQNMVSTKAAQQFTNKTAGHSMQLTRYQEIPCFATCISLVINFNRKVLVSSLYDNPAHTEICVSGIHILVV